MPTLSDARFEALRNQGFEGATSDMLLQWLQANGATSNAVPDAWAEMLVAQGFDPNRNDGWYDFLGSLGYSGSVNDRAYQFWSDGGVISADGVRIVTQPPNWQGTEGQDATFTVVAESGDLSPLTYQWEENFNGYWEPVPITRYSGDPLGTLADRYAIINNSSGLVDNFITLEVNFRVLVSSHNNAQRGLVMEGNGFTANRATRKWSAKFQTTNLMQFSISNDSGALTQINGPTHPVNLWVDYKLEIGPGFARASSQALNWSEQIAINYTPEASAPEEYLFLGNAANVISQNVQMSEVEIIKDNDREVFALMNEGSGLVMVNQGTMPNGVINDEFIHRILIDRTAPTGGTTSTLTVPSVDTIDNGRRFRCRVCNDVNCLNTRIATLQVTGATWFIMDENGNRIFDEVPGNTNETVDERSQ